MHRYHPSPHLIDETSPHCVETGSDTIMKDIVQNLTLVYTVHLK